MSLYILLTLERLRVTDHPQFVQRIKIKIKNINVYTYIKMSFFKGKFYEGKNVVFAKRKLERFLL